MLHVISSSSVCSVSKVNCCRLWKFWFCCSPSLAISLAFCGSSGFDLFLDLKNTLLNFIMFVGESVVHTNCLMKFLRGIWFLGTP